MGRMKGFIRAARSRRQTLGWLIATVLLMGLIALSAMGQDAGGGGTGSGGAADTIAREDTAACLACHSEIQEGEHGGAHKVAAVNEAALKASPHKDLACQDCHMTIDRYPHTPEMLNEKADCGTCHSEANDAFLKSVHSKKDIEPGDHPTCASCHGKNADPHAVTPIASFTRMDRARLCSDCHRETARMKRYNVDPDAVPSYEESFHGKAFLRFGMTNAAICSDCHRNHDVLSPDDPAAPTHRNNAAQMCAQCHAGAKVNFAMSGVNHLRLKVKENIVLRIEKLFFEALTLGTILFLLGGIALDLRKKVFGPHEPASGRPVALLISLSFLLVVTALALGFFGIGGAVPAGVAAFVLLILAFVLYMFRPRAKKEAVAQQHRKEKRYKRFTTAQRIQHAVLAISFTLLVLTGLPIRFPGIEWLGGIYVLFGGLQGARLVHRIAAVVMIADWIWHTLYLIYRWRKAGFTWQSWTMWPSRKDLADFIAVSKYYLGFAKEEPKYDRFQFREKFDYFAVYWGMPIMVFSGLVLWFPVYFGNILPEIGLSFAYIAHSDEAILAFLAIVLWHFYNTHFNPDNFPMADTWYTGTKTESEMEREHPLELERLRTAEASGPSSSGAAAAAAPPPSTPPPSTPPPAAPEADRPEPPPQP